MKETTNFENEMKRIERKISALEESYKKIENAWTSSAKIKTRIDSLLALAKELRSIEGMLA